MQCVQALDAPCEVIAELIDRVASTKFSAAWVRATPRHALARPDERKTSLLLVRQH